MASIDLGNDLEGVRQNIEAVAAQMAESVKDIGGISKETIGVSYPDGSHSIHLNIYKPANSSKKLPALYHTHGGGLVTGKPELGEPGIKAIISEFPCIIVSVVYRLAPEFPFPTPLEDVYLGLKWVFDNASNLGVDPARIGIYGESAGGGLTAALAQLSRDRNEFSNSIAYQLLCYPMLDCRNTEPLAAGEEDTISWTKENNIFGWRSYLGGDPLTMDIPLYASAIHNNNLESLPPALIVVGGIDLFVDECIEYAKRLNHAGVSTELHVYPGGYHGFEMMAPEPGISKQLHRDLMNGIKKALIKS